MWLMTYVTYQLITDNTHSFILEEEMIGRNDDKEKVKNHLVDMNTEQNISFIVIAGTGGVGKTTLAKFLYNDREVCEFFDLRMWVYVSKLFDVKIVVKSIIESSTSNRPETFEMESLQSQLQKVIEGNKYLLVLDDLWNENEEKWFDLKTLLMGGAKGSKIVITKRDNKLTTEIADTTLMYDLKSLSEENSWSLFKKVAFKGGEEPNHPNLIKLGKEIVQECKGNPLVIKSIGRVLYFKTSEEEWMSFKDKLQRENENVISNLKCSYDHLPSSYLKQCFIYCSLFSKGCAMSEDELIRQSIAQGFIQSSDSSKSIEDVGDDYLMELCWTSMLQSSGSEREEIYYLKQRRFRPNLPILEDFCPLLHVPKKYVMNDLMHDLAQMVASDECKSINSEVGLNGVSENTRHISFLCKRKETGDDISFDDHKLQRKRDELPTSLFKAKGSRTFLLYQNPDSRIEFNESILEKLISSFVRLRVLKLTWSSIKEVSKSINQLRHLRYLDLSENHYLELLPNSISELQYLQTLDLHGCFVLNKLPGDISNLVNLRHLDLNGTFLMHMPEGMGKLTCLQTLNMFVLSKKKKNAGKLSELKGLNHLRGRLVIRDLKHLNSKPSEASLASLKDKEHLQDLILEWEPTENDDEVDDERVLEGLKPHPNVESLCIIRYMGERVSNWTSSLWKLTVIQINACHRLHHLPQFDQLPVLKCLNLSHLLALEFIDNKDSFSSSVFFPSLRFLHLCDMPNLKGWWKCESKPRLLPYFPPLVELVIINCPKLAYMPLHSDLKYVKLGEISLKTLEIPLASMLRHVDPSSVNTFSPFALENLKLAGIEDLEFLPDQLWPHLNKLKFLSIKKCQNFRGFVSDSISDGIKTGKLRVLKLNDLPKLVSLPIGPQHLTTLRSLDITDCCNFTHLPEWIDSFVSLEKLTIFKCPELKSLPEGMGQLKSLRTLRIVRCHVEVEERCKQGGEDWPKIAHVQQVFSPMR